MSDSPHGKKPPGSVPPPENLAAWVLDEALEQVAIAALDGALLYLNRPGRAALELAPDAPLTGLTLSDLQPAWAWQLVQAEGIPIALEEGSWNSETAARAPGGAEIPVAQRLVDSSTGAGERRLASIMRDLSEVKRGDVVRMEIINRYETAIRLSGHVLLDWEPFTG